MKFYLFFGIILLFATGVGLGVIFTNVWPCTFVDNARCTASWDLLLKAMLILAFAGTGLIISVYKNKTQDHR